MKINGCQGSGVPVVETSPLAGSHVRHTQQQEGREGGDVADTAYCNNASHARGQPL